MQAFDKQLFDKTSHLESYKPGDATFFSILLIQYLSIYRAVFFLGGGHSFEVDGWTAASYAHSVTLHLSRVFSSLTFVILGAWYRLGEFENILNRSDGLYAVLLSVVTF